MKAPRNEESYGLNKKKWTCPLAASMSFLFEGEALKQWKVQ